MKSHTVIKNIKTSTVLKCNRQEKLAIRLQFFLLVCIISFIITDSQAEFKMIFSENFKNDRTQYQKDSSRDKHAPRCNYCASDEKQHKSNFQKNAV